jgi:predicted enzyme related to lactoylglutathione lyase
MTQAAAATTAVPVSTAITWFEIPAANLARAQRFYETILETPLQTVRFGDADIAVFPAQDDGVKGCLGQSTHPSPHGTMVYINVEGRLDRTLDLVDAAGGRIVRPKTELPHNIGWVAEIVDSEGNRVGLHSTP